MADNARKLTDARLRKMEEHLAEIYDTARDEISHEWRLYMAEMQARTAGAYADYLNAMAAGNPQQIADTLHEYQRLIQNQTLGNDHYREMVDQVTANLYRVNEIATAYINGEMPAIYTVNYNALGTHPVAGYSFEFVDEETVRMLSTTDFSMLPYRTVNSYKDRLWNKKAINSQLLQGILQGESVGDIAARLRNITDMNLNASLRNARTMTTCAENKGRQASFTKAAEDGVIMKKVWVATYDGRTRESHLLQDGEEREIDEEFTNGLEYPGDEAGAPEEVYNCRCTMKTKIIGFRKRS